MNRMQNRQKKIAILTAGMLAGAAIVLTGCGDGGVQEEYVIGTLEAQPILSSLELEIVNLETKYRKEQLTGEEYLTLAKDYGESNRVREERDLLEQSYRLYEDTEAFELLQTLTVNLIEEETQILQTAENLQENMAQDDTLGEAIQTLTGEEWFPTLMPKLKEGQRNYYLDSDGELYLQVGYREDGTEDTKVWYTAGERSIFLQNTEHTMQIVIRTGEKIESYYLDAGTGNITREQGTMKNDVLTGEYTCDIYTGETATDLSNLWNSRGDLEYTTYRGEFDAEGRTLVEQPAESEVKKLLSGSGYEKAVLYAYDADTGRCLWQGLDAGTAVESYCFGGAMLGLQSIPAYTPYEAQPMTEQKTEETEGISGENTAGEESAENIARVRVFDGEIQWYDGKYWVSAGKAADLIQEDPFLAYAERDNAGSQSTTGTQSTTDSQSGENSTSTGDMKTIAGKKNIGTVTITSNQTTAGDKTGVATKPATTKPTATSKPATTEKPAATTNTAGSNTNNNAGANNSSSSGNSSGSSSSSGSGSNSGSSSSSGGSGSSSGGGSSAGSGSSSSGGSSADSGSSSSGGSSSDSGSSSGGGSSSDSGSSSGGGSSSDSGSSSGGDSGSDSGSSSGGDSGSGGSSGGDVDVDWSPDIM